MEIKSKEKNLAIKLRKQGLSYNEILKKVPVSKSTISCWCKDIKLTFKQKQRIELKKKDNLQKLMIFGPRAMKKKREREIKKIKTKAKKEIKPLTFYQIKIIGSMLYWAEGSKKRKVEITNSDPDLIKFMVYWFENICGIDPGDFRARLNIHANQNDRRIKKYWSRVTGISSKRFCKTYIKPEGTGHRKNILHNGVIGVRSANEDLRYRIMAWVKAIYLKA